ncbi:hypothetical protein D3C78_1435880 [compost metagenome]
MRIGPMTRMASCSGTAMATCLGIRSVMTMNSEVVRMKDTTKPRVAACCASSRRANSSVNSGLNMPSPTMPPRMASAFMPICTTVK